MPQDVARRPTRPARKRPTAGERREEILQQGLRCFASRGFNGTTTREVAAGVGITEAALYRYFPSKESLYEAIIARKIAVPPLVGTLVEAAGRRDDEAVFLGLARGVMERGAADPDFVRILFFTALESHALAMPLFRSHIGPLREFVTDYVRTRIADGAFRPIDPGLGARAFLGMIRDYLNVRVVHGQAELYPQPVDQVVSTFVDLFLAGIRRPDAAAERESGS